MRKEKKRRIFEVGIIVVAFALNLVLNFALGSGIATALNIGGGGGGFSFSSTIETPIDPPEPFVYGCADDKNPLNGFIDDWGNCVPGLPTNETWFRKMPRYAYGTAVYYGPWMMEGTARYREMSLDGYLDGVALLSPGDIGETVWIRRSGYEWEGPFLSVDCGRRADIYTEVVLTQEVVEVGYVTAKRWGLVKDDPTTKKGWKALGYKVQTVEVWVGKEKPSENIDFWDNPVYYAQWWLDRVEYMKDSIDLQPRYYRNGENPEWDIRDGKGRRCFTYACQENEGD
jgi:hypothetical protein